MPDLFNAFPARRVVPVPKNGSKTRSPSFE